MLNAHSVVVHPDRSVRTLSGAAICWLCGKWDPSRVTERWVCMMVEGICPESGVRYWRRRHIGGGGQVGGDGGLGVACRIRRFM